MDQPPITRNDPISNNLNLEDDFESITSVMDLIHNLFLLSIKHIDYKIDCYLCKNQIQINNEIKKTRTSRSN